MAVVDLLRQVSIFADLCDKDLSTLATCLGKRTFARGMMPFQKGSLAQSLYVIESGEVRISRSARPATRLPWRFTDRASALARPRCSTGISGPPAPWRSKRP